MLIAKLEWAKLGGSDRQVEDAAGILRLQGATLDTAYVERWINDLGLTVQWERARALAV